MGLVYQVAGSKALYYYSLGLGLASPQKFNLYHKILLILHYLDLTSFSRIKIKCQTLVFLCIILVSGCADIEPLPNTFAERNGDTTTLACVGSTYTVRYYTEIPYTLINI